METSQSIEIMANMIQASRKSLHKVSFYFILWGLLLVPAGIAEFLLRESGSAWMVWPIVGTLGGIISRNKEAYTYLPNSIDEFLTQDNLCEELRRAGLEPIYVKGFSMNISTLFIARKI